MAPFQSFFYPKNLRTRLMSWFLLISLLPLLWTTFIFYQFSKKMLLDQASTNLQNLSLRQSQIIENYFRDKERNILIFAKGKTIANALDELNKALYEYGKHSSQYQQLNEFFRSNLALRTEAAGYSNLLLLNAEGRIVFSLTSPEAIGTNILLENDGYASLRNLFVQAKSFLQAEISNFLYYDPNQLPAAFVAAPVLNPSFKGIMVGQIDNTAIFNLLTDYSGFGDTGESILVTKMGQKILSIAPLRHADHQYPFQEISSHNPFGQFILEVMNGQRLVKEIIDYRDEKSLVVGRYFFPGLNWAIITKMDIHELLEPIKKLKLLAFFLVLTTAAIVALTASSVAQAISYPILMLIRKTRLMTSGDLSQRIQVHSDDEVGRLGQSFNEMAFQLDTTVKNLDQIVAKRTKEVEMQNIKLEQTIEELQQTQDRLVSQEKLASLGALTAGIAHEIKNPLNFINNFAELSIQIEQELQNHLDKIKSLISTDESNEIKELLNNLNLNLGRIYKHGKQADSIVHNMLQHSRGIAGEKMFVDINHLLDEYVTLAYHGMRAQDISFNVKIEKSYDPNLPKIAVVPQEISRVFLNLLNNAYYSVHQKKKQMPEDYVPTVRISTQKSGDLVIIKIWDNGLGISDEIFPKLFTPFFTTKPPGEGTGLGLSLSYTIVTQGHNGVLMADSEPGEFAEFTIQLPIRANLR